MEWSGRPDLRLKIFEYAQMSLPRRGSSAFVVTALTGPDYTGRRFGTLLAHLLPQNATKRHDCALLSHCVYTW
jgi:hypothetical protein